MRTIVYLFASTASGAPRITVAGPGVHVPVERGRSPKLTGVQPRWPDLLDVVYVDRQRFAGRF